MPSDTLDQPGTAKGRPAGKRITTADVRASIKPRAKQETPALTYFGRPLGNLITPNFYNAGWTADSVTLLRVGLAAIALVLLAVFWPWGPMLAALVYYVTFVLDCVDGNLARLNDDATYWGKYADGLGDYVYLMGAPLATGVGALFHTGEAKWLLMGGAIAVMALINQMCRERLNFFREWMTGQSGPLEKSVAARAATPALVERWAAEIMVGGTFLAPIALLVPALGPLWYLAVLISVQLVPDIAWFGATLWKARIWLARGRTSIHAAKPPAA